MVLIYNDNIHNVIQIEYTDNNVLFSKYLHGKINLLMVPNTTIRKINSLVESQLTLKMANKINLLVMLCLVESESSGGAINKSKTKVDMAW